MRQCARCVAIDVFTKQRQPTDRGKKRVAKKKKQIKYGKMNGARQQVFLWSCVECRSACILQYTLTPHTIIHIFNTRVNAVSVFGRSRVPIVRYVNEWIVAAMLWATTQYSHRHNDRISLHTSYTHSICVIDRRWCVRQALNNTNSKEARLHCLMVEQ